MVQNPSVETVIGQILMADGQNLMVGGHFLTDFAPFRAVLVKF